MIDLTTDFNAHGARFCRVCQVCNYPNKDQGIRAGRLATVENIAENGAMTVKLDNGKKVELDPAKARHIDHGYAVDSKKTGPVERVLVSIAGAPEIAQNSLVHKAIASASKDATIYTSEQPIIKIPTPAILPSDRPAQQQQEPKEAKEQKESIALSLKKDGGRLVIEPAERMPTWAEHTVRWNPINKALTPPEANQFEWKAQSDTIQSYRHIETGRHIHIDGQSGKFYDQDGNPITKRDALVHAMPENHAHSQNKPSQTPYQPGLSERHPAIENSGSLVLDNLL